MSHSIYIQKKYTSHVIQLKRRIEVLRFPVILKPSSRQKFLNIFLKRTEIGTYFYCQSHLEPLWAFHFNDFDQIS